MFIQMRNKYIVIIGQTKKKSLYAGYKRLCAWNSKISIGEVNTCS